MKLKSYLQLFGAIAAVLTLVPLIAADYWWIRMFDFPHFQLTLLTLTAILIYFLRFDMRWRNDYLFITILTACFVYQMAKIYPYTPLAPYELLPATQAEGPNTLSTFTANVLQKNRESHLLLEEIKKFDADILLLTETDVQWQRDISSKINSAYRYAVEVPQSNTYGMLLYSKFPLRNAEVHRLVDDSIPSIHAQVVLPSSQTIQLYGIHPTPPMPQHNPSSTDRDAELMKIAKLSRESELPVIVMGDFNDVAWSATTSLFQKVSRLLDMRKGRGFYNTYNAKNPILRWPLDHIFISREFRLLDLQLGDKVNSDHFPVYTKLILEPAGAGEQSTAEASEQELKQANEIIAKEEQKNSG